MEFIQLSENQISNAKLFHIIGRNPVLALNDRENKEPRYFKDKYIYWEGLTYLVIGLECYQYPMHPPILSPAIGLVLRLIKEDNEV